MPGARAMTPRRAIGCADPATLLERHLPLIDRIIASLRRRNRWLGEDGKDFGQWVRMRLFENDHALVRAHAGRASLASYLTVVIHNLMRDFRNAHYGRWRPSAAARRLGEVGVQLDTLIHRDGRSRAEAIEILRRNRGVAHSADTLDALASTLPPHYPRHQGDDTGLDRLPAAERTDRPLAEREAAARAARTEQTLKDVISQLDDQACLLIKLRFFEGFRIAQIARRLKQPAKPLYRTFERLLVVLRQRLEAAGLTAGEAAEVLRQDLPVTPEIARGCETAATGPSFPRGER